MANVLLGVTGSVAAIRIPELFAALQAAGHSVKVVATHAALYFFDPNSFATPGQNFFVDEDEWPGRKAGYRYQRDDPVLHIELRRWADLLVIAPLDANTLAKLTAGLCDNCLTCIARAWEPSRPIVLAPAMNTLMWDHPLTARHLRQLAADGGGEISTSLDPNAVAERINQMAGTLRIAPPQCKRLACGDVGMGAMADVGEIVSLVQAMLVSKPPVPRL